MAAALVAAAAHDAQQHRNIEVPTFFSGSFSSVCPSRRLLLCLCGSHLPMVHKRGDSDDAAPSGQTHRAQGSAFAPLIDITYHIRFPRTRRRLLGNERKRH